MTGWLGVVSHEHVRRGVDLGIVQIGHGKRGGLARMHAGDTIVYYSPRERLGDNAPLQAFTALGAIADEEIWQADEGDFHPWRRRATYERCRVTPVATLMDRLDLTAAPNWGYQLRRGLLALSDRDLATLQETMLG